MGLHSDERIGQSMPSSLIASAISTTVVTFILALQFFRCRVISLALPEPDKEKKIQN